MTFSKRLKSIRDSANKTQREVALEIGLSERGYQRLESDSNPSFCTLLKLAKHFNVSLDYLCGLSEDKTKK